MHPLLVHFPIALLMVAPLFVVITAVTASRAFMLSTLLLMVLGVAGAFAATSSGEEANAYMDIESMTGYEIAEEHGEVAEWSRNLFLVLTVLYAVLTGLTLGIEKMRGVVARIVINLVFLLMWGYALTVLAEAAHLGGHLVHEFGARAPLAELLEVEEVEEDVDDGGMADDEADDDGSEQEDTDGDEAEIEEEETVEAAGVSE